MALVDAAHWATEAPWLRRARRAVARSSSALRWRSRCPDAVTDPWTLHDTRPATTGASREGRSRRATAPARPAGRRHRAGPARAPAHARCPSWPRSPSATQRAAALANEIIDAETALADVADEQRRLENEVDAVRARAARDEQRLQSGGVPAKELEGLQHEITTLARRQSNLEDELLEVMEQREEADAALVGLATQRNALAGEHRRAGGRARRARSPRSTSDRGRERRAVGSRRASCPADLLALYERAREHGGGVGAAMLRQRRCEGCRIELSGSELSAVRIADAGRGRAVRQLPAHPRPYRRIRPVSDRVVVEADGGSRGNPGPAGYGAVVLDAVDRRPCSPSARTRIGIETNNVAEYRGLIAGLQAARELGATRGRGADGLQARRRADERRLAGQARRRCARWPRGRRSCAPRSTTVSFEWIPRERNKHADRLANEAMDARRRAGPPARRAAARPAWTPAERHAHPADPRAARLDRALGANAGSPDATTCRSTRPGTAQAAALARGASFGDGGRDRQRRRCGGPGRPPTGSRRRSACRSTEDDDLAELDFGEWEGLHRAPRSRAARRRRSSPRGSRRRTSRRRAVSRSPRSRGRVAAAGTRSCAAHPEHASSS